MDELTLLRSIREETPAPDDETVTRIRHNLMQRIEAAEAIPRPRKPRTVRWIVYTGLTTAVVAALVVGGNIIGVGGLRDRIEPAAADVLHKAANATITTSDPVVGPGQYLEVATKAVYSASGFPGVHTMYLSSQDGQLYIPADTSSDLIWVRDPEKVVQTFGPESEAAATHYPPALPDGAYHRYPSGTGPAESWASPASLQALPRDPSLLLKHIYTTTQNQGQSRDGAAFVWIADTLRMGGIVPADLRAALYKAAAGIPGITITNQEATLDGRTGVAIGHTESTTGITQEIIINPTNGLLIGEREILGAKAAPFFGVPAGTSIGWTAVTTTVVDAAPEQ